MPRKGNFSRRDFLKTGVAAGITSILVPTESIGKIANPSGSEKLAVPTRPFGKTGIEISCLSLGSWPSSSNVLLLKQALNWGVTHWDTADNYGYGRSEKVIGKFFAKYPETRRKVFLVTKSTPRDVEDMERMLHRSLKRLQTDYIDLYFAHNIKSIKELSNKIRAWADKAKAAGKIRLFGFSTHSNMEDCMLAAAKLGYIDGIMMTYNYRLMHKSKMKEAVSACSEAGIGLTAMKTQGGGQIDTHNETELKLAGRFVREGFTDKQAKLMAVWEEPNIASICSYMPNLTILMSNVAAALKRTSFSAHDRGLLVQFANETASSYCAGCTTICETTHDGKVPIGDIMRYLMYYHSYGECDQARSLYGQLSRDIRERLNNFDYSLAEKKCPQRVPIRRLMREACRILAS